MTRTCAACRDMHQDTSNLCDRCTERLERDLAETEAYSGELQTTRLRQSRTGSSNIGVINRSEDRPLPWDQHAAEVADHLHSLLVSWTRMVVEERGVTCPADDDGALARFLLRHVDWLRHHPAAADAVTEIGSAVGHARRAVDTRPAMAYAGPCRADYHPEGEAEVSACCLAELYVRSGSAHVRCRECDTEHDVAVRQNWLLRVVEDQLVDTQTLVRAVSTLSRPITTSMVRGYVHRGRLTSKSKDPAGRALYRVGDLLDLLAGIERREQSA